MQQRSSQQLSALLIEQVFPVPMRPHTQCTTLDYQPSLPTKMPAFVWEKMKSRMRHHTTEPDVGCCRIGITQCQNVSYLLAIWIYRCLHAFVSRRASPGAGCLSTLNSSWSNPLCADFYLVQKYDVQVPPCTMYGCTIGSIARATSAYR